MEYLQEIGKVNINMGPNIWTHKLTKPICAVFLINQTITGDEPLPIAVRSKEKELPP